MFVCAASPTVPPPSSSISASSTPVLPSFEVDGTPGMRDENGLLVQVSPAASTSSKSSVRDGSKSIHVSPLPSLTGRKTGHSSPRSDLSTKTADEGEKFVSRSNADLKGSLGSGRHVSPLPSVSKRSPRSSPGIGSTSKSASWATSSERVSLSPTKKRTSNVPRVASLAKPAPKKEVPHTPPNFRTGKMATSQNLSSQHTPRSDPRSSNSLGRIERNSSSIRKFSSERKSESKDRSNRRMSVSPMSSTRASREAALVDDKKNESFSVIDVGEAYSAEGIGYTPKYISPSTISKRLAMERSEEEEEKYYRKSDHRAHAYNENATEVISVQSSRSVSPTRIPTPRSDIPPKSNSTKNSKIPLPGSLLDEKKPTSEDKVPNGSSENRLEVDINEVRDFQRDLQEIKTQLGISDLKSQENTDEVHSISKETSDNVSSEKYEEVLDATKNTVETIVETPRDTRKGMDETIASNDNADIRTDIAPLEITLEKENDTTESKNDSPVKSSKLCCTIM